MTHAKISEIIRRYLSLTMTETAVPCRHNCNVLVKSIDMIYEMSHITQMFKLSESEEASVPRSAAQLPLPVDVLRFIFIVSCDICI